MDQPAGSVHLRPSERAFPGGLGASAVPQGGPKCCPAGPQRRPIRRPLRCPHLHQRVGDLVVDLLREVVHIVGAIEGELLGRLVGGAGVLDEALATSGVHSHHGLTVQLQLPLVHGAAAHHHLHRLRGHGAAAGVPGARPDVEAADAADAADAAAETHRPARGPRSPGPGGEARARRGGAGPRGKGLAAAGGPDSSGGAQRGGWARRGRLRIGAGAAASSRARACPSLRPSPGGGRGGSALQALAGPRPRAAPAARPLARTPPGRSRLPGNARGVTGGGSRERQLDLRAGPQRACGGRSPGWRPARVGRAASLSTWLCWSVCPFRARRFMPVRFSNAHSPSSERLSNLSRVAQLRPGGQA